MTNRQETVCTAFILLAALCVLPKHFLVTPIRWDFIHAYGADVFLILRPSTITAHIWEYILLGVLWLACWGTGRLMLRLVVPETLFLSDWAARLLVGLGLLSHLLFALSVAQFLNRTAISVLLGVGVLIGIRELFQVFRVNPKKKLADVWSARPRSPEAIAICLAGLFLIAGSFFSSLLPPTQSDALRYHLTTPRLWLDHGGFCRIPHISFSNFPMTIDILYTVPLAYGLPSVAKLLHWSFLIAALGMLYRIGCVLGGRSAAWLSVTFFVSIPFVPILASWAYVEMGLCAYMLLMAGAALELAGAAGAKQNMWRNAVMLGLAGGWLLGCKYTSIIYLFLLSLLLILPRSWLGLPCFAKKSVVFAGFIAFLIASPWYVKNVLYNGNPVYPMAVGVFGEREWTKANAAFFSFHAGVKGDLNAARYYSLPGKIVDTLSLAIRPLWSPIDIGQNDFGDWPVSALFLILLPALALRRGSGSCVRFLGVFGAFLFVVWAWTYRDARFLLVSFCILSLPLAICCSSLWERRQSFRLLIVVLVLFYGLWNLGKFCDRSGFSPWRVASGVFDREQYLRLTNQTTRTFYHGFEAVDRLVPPGRVILIHGQHYNFQVPRRFVAADWFDTPPLIVLSREAGSVSKLIARLHQKEIFFLLHDKTTIGRYNNSIAFPAYWLLCLPPEQGVRFIGRLRDLEPLRVRDRDAWLVQVREWHASVADAIKRDPGWLRLEAFLTSPSLRILYDRGGMRVARIESAEES